MRQCLVLLFISVLFVVAVKTRAVESNALECKDSLHVLVALETLRSLDFVHAVVDGDSLPTVALK